MLNHLLQGDSVLTDFGLKGLVPTTGGDSGWSS